MKLIALELLRLNGEDVSPGSEIDADDLLAAVWIEKKLAAEPSGGVAVMCGDTGPVAATVIPDGEPVLVKKSKKAK